MREPLHVSDVVDFIRRSCVGIHGHAYCISGPEVVTIIGMAETMADVLGRKLDNTPICLETLASDPDEHSQCDKETDLYSYQRPSHCREHWQLFATHLFPQRLRRCWMSGDERRPEGETSLAVFQDSMCHPGGRFPASSAGPLQIIWRAGKLDGPNIKSRLSKRLAEIRLAGTADALICSPGCPKILGIGWMACLRVASAF